jgi:hypothetical protein
MCLSAIMTKPHSIRWSILIFPIKIEKSGGKVATPLSGQTPKFHIVGYICPAVFHYMAIKRLLCPLSLHLTAEVNQLLNLPY